MTNVRSIATAPDRDAEYVLRRIALIEECDSAIKDRSRERDAARTEAGLRLIEVRARYVKPGQRACPGFASWCRAHGIPQQTASDLMRDAGFNGGDRKARTQRDAERKKKQRKQKKAAALAVASPDFIYQQPCEDCNGEEERWQRSFANLAGDAIAMPAFWTKEFGKGWEAYAVTSDMVTLAEQAAASWRQVLMNLKARRRA